MSSPLFLFIWKVPYSNTFINTTKINVRKSPWEIVTNAVSLLHEYHGKPLIPLLYNLAIEYHKTLGHYYDLIIKCNCISVVVVRFQSSKTFVVFFRHVV